MTYRELHAKLATTEAPYSLGYATLKTEVATHLANTNPIAVAATIRALVQMGAVEAVSANEWRVNAVTA